MRLARLVAFIVGCMMMSSCLAVYEQADKSQPHATLEFSYGTYDERFGSISGEEFKVVASTACDSPRRIATSRQSFEAQNRRILAGEVIMLVATSAEPLANMATEMLYTFVMVGRANNNSLEVITIAETALR